MGKSYPNPPPRHIHNLKNFSFHLIFSLDPGWQLCSAAAAFLQEQVSFKDYLRYWQSYPCPLFLVICGNFGTRVGLVGSCDFNSKQREKTLSYCAVGGFTSNVVTKKQKMPSLNPSPGETQLFLETLRFDLGWWEGVLTISAKREKN